MALCGFSLEVTHLDGRKLLIQTAAGEIVKPMTQGYGPLADDEGKCIEWDVIENCDCPSIDTVAQADTTDVDTLKNACETQLKRKGVDVGAFVIDSNRAYFKQCSREEALAAKTTKNGSTMYVISDPDAKKSLRMIKAVRGEGMPTYKNPFVHGNLFLLLTVEFPDVLSNDNQNAIKKFLPPPLNVPKWKEDDCEIHNVTEIDPVESYSANKVNMSTGGEAYDDDEEEDSGRMPGPCQQQ